MICPRSALFCVFYLSMKERKEKNTRRIRFLFRWFPCRFECRTKQRSKMNPNLNNTRLHLDRKRKLVFYLGRIFSKWVNRSFSIKTFAISKWISSEQTMDDVFDRFISNRNLSLCQWTTSTTKPNERSQCSNSSGSHSRRNTENNSTKSTQTRLREEKNEFLFVFHFE